jgi:hypothetical protein
MKFFVSMLIVVSLTLGSLATASAAKKEAPAPADKKAAKPVEKKDAKPADTKATAAAPVKEAAPAPEVPVDPEKVIVTVNGTPIKEKQIAADIDKRITAQTKKMEAMGWPADDKSKKMMRDHFRDNVVDMQVERTLVAEQLKAAKITVTPADADARFLEVIKNANRTLEEATKDIEKQGMSVADIKGEIYWQVCVEKLYASKPENKPTSEADAKKFFDENPQYFEQPEQVRASHILIKTEGMDDAKKAEAKKKIEDILKKARSGEDFATLAKTYTEDPGSKETGGEYTFPKGKMVPEFEKAAFALEVGKISDVVETQFGYHIIKLSEKIPAKKHSFDEMKTKIIDELNRQNVGKFWTKYSEEMKKSAKVEWSPEEKARRDQKEKEEKEQQMQQMKQQQQSQEIPPMPEPKADTKK